MSVEEAYLQFVAVDEARRTMLWLFFFTFFFFAPSFSGNFLP